MRPDAWARIPAALLLALALAWPLLPGAQGATGSAAIRPAFEWPHDIDGEGLRPVALTDVERRFAERFPGSIGRFASRQATWILRHVEAPTRMLHPAKDCFRGLGYRIEAERLVRRPAGLERCFRASRAGTALEVCERIVDADGGVFTDTSAWYWSAALGRSRGPWLASTRAAPAAWPPGADTG